ncbi:MAG: hypothetical protein ACTSWM_00685 [Alphaproteobacteria bacterium]
MIVIVAIPHQTPPRMYWYKDAAKLVCAADEYAEEHGVPRAHGFDDPVFDAAHTLASGWHSCLVIRSADDLEDVRTYRGHQEHYIRPLAALLEPTFLADVLE